MAAHRHPLRSHILILFQRGDLVSVAEAVLICDASRQAISKWIKTAGINVEARRMAYIGRQRSRAQLIHEGRGPRKPSPMAQHRADRRAVARLNALTRRGG